MAKLRVVVADDSITVRHRLVEVLEQSADFEVVGQAENGKRAVELCTQLRPDVITIDMAMPEMNGVEATEEIMAHVPTPILIVSASLNRGDLFDTYEALSAGAIDVLEKPSGEEHDDVWEARFLSTLRIVARVKPITHPRARLRAAKERKDASLSSPPPLPVSSLLAIGASTGGPQAIVEVLRSLPVGMASPILVLLHIDEPFGTAFAEWLDGTTAHRVAYAQHGQPVIATAGRVTMAPPGRHLVVRHGLFELTSDPPRHSCRPSIDVLFESIAREYGSRATACLLTGMGRDGAQGLLEIRRAGGFTIAQDELTSVVYGMPREAAILGAADRILPIGEVGPAMLRGAK